MACMVAGNMSSDSSDDYAGEGHLLKGERFLGGHSSWGPRRPPLLGGVFLGGGFAYGALFGGALFGNGFSWELESTGT